MRTVKKHEERRKEILDVAERLFYAKGYERCTINDILNETAIAKGTFYHYFKSKEDVIDAIISRYIDMVQLNTGKVLDREDLHPEEKLMHVFAAMRLNDQIGGDVLDDLHRADNALLHQKILSQMIDFMAPVLVKVINEGIEKKVWRCRYPQHSMQIFLAAALTLTDEGIFEVDPESQMKLMAALLSVLERMLEVPEDSFLHRYLNNMDGGHPVQG